MRSVFDNLTKTKMGEMEMDKMEENKTVLG